MAYAAFIDTVRPGYREQVIDACTSPGPATATRPPGLLAVTAFLRGDTLLRVAEIEDGANAAALLAEDTDTVARWRRLRPCLADGDGSGPMSRVQQRIVRPAPEAELAALWFDVRPGFASRITEIFTGVRPQQRPTLRAAGGETTGLLHGVAVFVRGPVMIRVVAYTGDLTDVARYMATRPGRPEIERQLAPFLADERETVSTEGFLAAFPERVMRPLPVAAPVR